MTCNSNIHFDYLQFDKEPERDITELIQICKKEISSQIYKSSLTLDENIKLNYYIDEKLNNIPINDSSYNNILHNMIFMKKYLIYNYISFYSNIYDKQLGFILNIIELSNIIYDEIISNTNHFYGDYKHLFNIIIKYDIIFIERKNNFYK